MDGRSLIPVVQQPGIERGRELLIEEPIGGSRGFEAIRTERYMYAEHSTGEKELYDLQQDPFELGSRHNNPAYASVKAQLATELSATGSTSWATSSPARRPSSTINRTPYSALVENNISIRNPT